MSQLVETEQGVAEFPDEMSHDEIAGVIKRQFYSADNPPPKEVQPSGFSAIGLGSSEFAMPGQMAEGFDPIEAAKAQTSSESLAPIPQIPQQEGILKQTGAALVNTATGAVNFATSPAGLSTLPVATANPVLGRILAGAYAPEMITEGVRGAVNEPTWQGKLQSSLGALLGLGGAVHTTGLVKQLTPISKEGVIPESVAPIIERPIETPIEAEKAATETLLTKETQPSEPVGAEEALPVTSQAGVAEPLAEEAKPVSEVEQAPVESGLQAKPELPENVEVTIKASTSKGEELEVKMDAREAEKVLNERKTALENLIDCLGA